MSHLSPAAPRLARPVPPRDSAGRHAPAPQAWLGSAVLAVACFAGVSVLLAGLSAKRDGGAEPSPVAVAAAPTALRWIDVPRPFPAFDVAGGPFGRLPMVYEAQRDENDAARRDTLTFGTVRPGQPFLRIVFTRHGDASRRDATLFLDATRLAAAMGLAVERSGPPTDLPSRFGPFETIAVTLARGGRATECQAFRRTGDVLSLIGLACAGDDRTSAAPLACTLDKIDLLAAGDDLPLRALFVTAERQRGLGCVDGRGGRGLPANTMRPPGGT